MPTVIRPVWVPETDEQREALRRAVLTGEMQRMAEMTMWRAILTARDLGVPDEVLCRDVGVSRSTLNRHFGRRGSLQRPEWWTEPPP